MYVIFLNVFRLYDLCQNLPFFLKPTFSFEALMVNKLYCLQEVISLCIDITFFILVLNRGALVYVGDLILLVNGTEVPGVD